MDRAGVLPKANRVDKTRFLLDLVRNRKALHLGCAGGLLTDEALEQYAHKFDASRNLHARMANAAAHMTGVDLSGEKIAVMSAAGLPSNFVVADITSDCLVPTLGDTYEVVVLGDVIEHLDNAGLALRNCAALLSDRGVLVITTNNAFYFGGLVKLLANYESVNSEHTCYYSYRTMTRTLAQAGLKSTGFWYGRHKRTAFSTVFDRMSFHASEFVAAVFPQYSQSIFFTCEHHRGSDASL